MNLFYHGHGRRPPYFEGWYLKLQSPRGQSLALIPALHTAPSGTRRASLQVISQKASWYLDYPGNAFLPSRQRFQLRLDKNLFNAKGMHLDVDKGGLSLHGSVQFAPFTPLRSDIMGPFRFVPGMECAHGVLSMGHSLGGSLYLNGEQLDFSGGLGYVETDRGRSFPHTYLWAQCAWGAPGQNSLMLSVASIPMGFGSFTGCICALLFRGKEFRLATYRGARVDAWGARGAVIRQGSCRLAVELLQSQPLPLRAPALGSMERTIHESLSSTLRCRFWRGNQLIFDHIDHFSGFEYAKKADD